MELILKLQKEIHLHFTSMLGYQGIYVYTLMHLFPYCCVLYVCMHMYMLVYEYVHVHMCTYYNAFQIGMRKLCP